VLQGWAPHSPLYSSAPPESPTLPPPAGRRRPRAAACTPAAPPAAPLPSRLAHATPRTPQTKVRTRSSWRCAAACVCCEYDRARRDPLFISIAPCRVWRCPRPPAASSRRCPQHSCPLCCVDGGFALQLEERNSPGTSKCKTCHARYVRLYFYVSRIPPLVCRARSSDEAPTPKDELSDGLHGGSWRRARLARQHRGRIDPARRHPMHRYTAPRAVDMITALYFGRARAPERTRLRD